MTDKFDIGASLALAHSRMDRFTADHGRNADAVTLIAVSKQQPDEAIDAALVAGQRVFGENRVQEAKARWADRRANVPDLRLHLIGPLQTNKVRDAVALFDCIQTVDRAELALALGREMARQHRPLPCLIQVNTGEEPQKAGIAPSELETLLAYCRAECGLTIAGLMCIPPFEEPPAPHFALLRKLARRHGLPDLSMGMSADFESAVALGATYVRLGTALFGERPTGTTMSGVAAG